MGHDMLGFANALRTRKCLVGAAGLEPARPESEDFKSPASANFATPPLTCLFSLAQNAVKLKCLGVLDGIAR